MLPLTISSAQAIANKAGDAKSLRICNRNEGFSLSYSFIANVPIKEILMRDKISVMTKI